MHPRFIAAQSHRTGGGASATLSLARVSLFGYDPLFGSYSHGMCFTSSLYSTSGAEVSTVARALVFG